MLLLFEVDGYKLFDHKIQFSMFPNRRIKKLKENIVVKTINNKEYHVLKSAIIYGPNNSGKLLLLSHFHYLRVSSNKKTLIALVKTS